jgi:glucokinase
VFQAAREGDDVASTIVSDAIYGLAAGVAGLLNIFDPEALIIGGKVADAGAELLIPLQEEVWARTRKILGREVAIVEQQVSDKSGIVGAAGLVMAPRS